MISDEQGRLVSSPVWVDFMRVDWERRVKLDLPGTRRDLERWGIELADGLRLVLYTEDADAEGRVDDLVTVGTVRYDSDEDQWTAEIDWVALVHVSELQREEAKYYRGKRSGTHEGHWCQEGIGI
jgi:hypothetical protein